LNNPELAHQGRGFTIHRIVTDPLENNVYRIDDDGSNASLIVDAAGDAERIIDFVGGRHIVAIATTHGHWDHHGAARAVSAQTHAPVLLHPLDSELAESAFDDVMRPGPMSIGDTTATIVHTPGHTPGSCCLVLDGVVLTGDTLFPGGPGATRFEHGDFGTIIESISAKLFTLDDGTVVLPGHGAATTIGTERPHLAEWIERGW
jgi:glyoxylase-like metal-dependent hydrolase (beta-lactamase superfamily II)